MWLRQLFDNISASGSSPNKTSYKKHINNKYRKPKPGKSNNFHKSGFNKNKHKSPNSLIGYHGTTSAGNAASVFKHGWLIGSGNAYGDGIYFTQDVSEAKRYSGSGGVYLKCKIYMGKTCHWDSTMEKKYSDWCSSGGIRSDNSAKTSFLLRKGFDTLKAGSIILVLEPQYSNPSAWKRRNRNIKILSVHRADNDQRVRV